MTELFGPSPPPPSPPLNWPQATIRLALELALLGALGYWGWSLPDSTLLGWIAAIGIPAAAAYLWGAFRVPGDSSAGQPPRYAVSGKVRLALELGLFVLGGFGLWQMGERTASEVFLIASGVHYLFTWQRIRWLITTP